MSITKISYYEDLSNKKILFQADKVPVLQRILLELVLIGLTGIWSLIIILAHIFGNTGTTPIEVVVIVLFMGRSYFLYKWIPSYIHRSAWKFYIVEEGFVFSIPIGWYTVGFDEMESWRLDNVRNIYVLTIICRDAGEMVVAGSPPYTQASIVTIVSIMKEKNIGQYEEKEKSQETV